MLMVQSIKLPMEQTAYQMKNYRPWKNPAWESLLSAVSINTDFAIVRFGKHVKFSK